MSVFRVIKRAVYERQFLMAFLIERKNGSDRSGDLFLSKEGVG